MLRDGCVYRIHSRRMLVDGGFRDGYVYYRDGVILSATEKDLPAVCTYDTGDDYLVPGFIDLHTHGACGYDYAECTEQEMLIAASYHMSHGTTTVVPTFSTYPIETYRKALSVVRAVMQREDGPRIGGAHMEGPYLSPKMSGAQNPDWIRTPNKEEYESLLAEFPDVIVRWTYAPELDPDGVFCDCLVSHGVVPTAGHTDAVYEEMEKAYVHGCASVTHMYCRSSGVGRRDGWKTAGVNEFAYDTPGMAAEIISDGRHVPLSLLHTAYHIMGAGRLCLVSDSLRMAGVPLADGETRMVGGLLCKVEDDVCKLADGSALAGSIATGDRLVRVCVQAGIPLLDALRMASETPARLMGWKRGKLETGYDADFVILSDDLSVKSVYVGGRQYPGAGA